MSASQTVAERSPGVEAGDRPVTPPPSEADPLPTGIRLTVLDPDFRADPYPALARLREHDPIHHDTELGLYFFTRHDDVVELLRHPDYWRDPRKGLPDGFARRFLVNQLDVTGGEPSMLLMDDPDHRRLRNLVRAPFAPRAVARWQARVRGIARRVVEAVAPDEFDLVEAVANPIPTVVIAELLGVDPERHGDFARWSEAVIRTAFNPLASEADRAAAEAARAELDAVFRSEIARRRETPGDDLISAMVAAVEAGDRLSDDEIAVQCLLLLLAGNVTTSDLIGNAVMALLRHPDQLAKLRARPELVPNAVEETLRYDTPVMDSGRIAHRDLEIRGVKIAAGESLSASLAAANRDPAIYPEPDRFDVERADTHHQAFGGGRHFCLGAHLARLEAAETLTALLDRFPTLEPGSEEAIYAASPSFRGLARFPIRGLR